MAAVTSIKIIADISNVQEAISKTIRAHEALGHTYKRLVVDTAKATGAANNQKMALRALERANQQITKSMAAMAGQTNSASSAYTNHARQVANSAREYGIGQ